MRMQLRVCLLLLFAAQGVFTVVVVFHPNGKWSCIFMETRENFNLQLNVKLIECLKDIADVLLCLYL